MSFFELRFSIKFWLLFSAYTLQLSCVVTEEPVDSEIPIAQSITQQTLEDNSITLTLSATTDTETTISFAIVSQPSYGTAILVDNRVLYTPNTHFFGDDSLTFIAESNGGSSSPTIATIEVTPVNDTPTATALQTSTAEDNDVTIALVGSDIEDGNAVAFAIASTAQNGTVSVDGTTVTYTPNLNFFGDDSFSYYASDSGGVQSDSATIAITVQAVNDIPTAFVDSATTSIAQTLTLVLTASDIEDEQSLIFSISSNPQRGTIDLVENTVYYYPSGEVQGTDIFSFRVRDSAEAFSPPATVAITILAFNNKPIALETSATLQEDANAVISLLGSDIEDQTLVYSLASTPSNGVVAIGGSQATYMPNANYFGSDTWSFTVRDSGGLISAPAVVAMTITTVNDTPTATATTYAIDEDTALNTALQGTDIEDGAAVAFAIASTVQNGTITLNASQISYIPNANFFGDDSFSFYAIDSDGVQSDPATIVITVQSINDVPLILSSISATLNEDFTASFTLQASDVEDGGSVTFAIGNTAQNGTVTHSANQITYTPNLNFFGSDSFSYYAIDSAEAQSAVAQGSISVTAVNDIPTASAGSATVKQGESVTINLQGSDVEDGVAIDYNLSIAPSDGTVTLNANQAVYTPNVSFSGSDDFSFTTSDSANAVSQPAQITLTVQDVILQISSFTADVQSPQIGDLITLTCSAEDIVGIASYSFSSTPSVSLITVSSNMVSYSAHTETVVTTCNVSDTSNATTSATLSITAVGDTDPPDTAVTYTAKIDFNWTSTTHANQPPFPVNPHFTNMPFIVHNDEVVYWTGSQLASSQLEPLAELGITSALVSLANSDPNTLNVVLIEGFSPVSSISTALILDTDHSLVTSASMIAPTPDWFTGVHDINLLAFSSTAQQHYWRSEVVVGLRGYDAGTEDGTNFALSNPDSSPQQNIHLLSEDSALIAAGYNIVENFGTITFTLNQ